MNNRCLLVVYSLSFWPLIFSKPLENSDIEINKIFDYGPYQVGETSYEYPMMNDVELTPTANNLTTQIRGQLFFPILTNDLTKNRLAILIFLPGKHPDCRFTTPPDYPELDLGSVNSSGLCPDGLTTVPSHLGFTYLGRYFASHGYIVSSIDVLMINNQWGIPGDNTLNFVRARLVLRTLEKMIEWDSSSEKSKQILGGVDLSGRFDFNQVGLMGHSRGGEGVRNAYVMLMENRGPSDASRWRTKLPNVNIRAIIEIAPMYYGQNGTKFGVENIPWAMIVSGCEDDEIDYAHVYLANNQRQTSKSVNYVIHVYGANHEYFNTEWQTGLNMCFGDQDPLWDVNAPTFKVGDLFPPARNTSLDLTLLKINGSELQRRTAIFVLSTFFRGHVGINANLAYAQFLEPSAPLPSNFTEIGREYFDNSQDLTIFRNSGNIVASAGVEISLLKDYGQKNFQAFATAYENAPVPPPHFVLNPPIKGNLSLGCVDSIETGFYIDFAANQSSEIWLGFTGVENKSLMNVDIQWARRSSCWFNAINSSICAEPREMPIEIELRTESTVVSRRNTSMKSRFNLQYGRCDAMDFPPEKIAFLPVMFETFRIRVNNSLGVTSLRIRAVNGGSLILGDITARIVTSSTGSFSFISSLHLFLFAFISFLSTISTILIH